MDFDGFQQVGINVDFSENIKGKEEGDVGNMTSSNVLPGCDIVLMNGDV